MRMARDRRWLFPAALGVALAAALLLVLLATRGSGSDRVPPGAATPEALAPANRLLAPEDLPGEGWAVSSERVLSSFAEAPQAFVPAAPELPECHPLRQFEANLLALDSTFREGTTRSFVKGHEPGAQARVTQLHVTLDSAEGAAAMVSAAAEALSGTSLNDCIRAILLRNNLEVTVDALAPLDAAGDGASQLARFEVGTEDAAPAMQGLLWWSEGADLFALSFASTGDAVSEADVRAAAQAAVRKASTP
jgi:hypothetical protein